MVPWVYAAVTLCLSFPEYHGFISFLGLNKGRGTIVERLNLADPANLYDGDRTNRRDFFITATKWITFPCASEPLLPKDGRATCLNSDDSALTSSSLLCLQDLPTYDPKTTVRLYLCRHGETENNRLNIIQGARVDPPINEKGSRQAMLLGLALSNAAHPPSLVLHSPLLRAKQTAQLASEQLLAGRSSEKRMIEMRNLKDLAEVDFGSMAEGAPVSQYRSEMMSLYCAWALGILDARMPGGGESGYEILSRIGSALQLMTEIAACETESSCLAAITHSSYLRLLIGAVEDFAFFSVTSPQSNCGINVLDFPRPINMSATNQGTISNKYPVTGEAKSSLKFVPTGKVVRVNERRHLNLIQEGFGI